MKGVITKMSTPVLMLDQALITVVMGCRDAVCSKARRGREGP